MRSSALINRVSVDAAFFKKLSPMENLSFAARLYGLDATTGRRDALAILARLGIGEKRVGRPIEQMSRGMQQKVAIARALLTSPALLLLDEPTTGLDPRSKLEVQGFIEELRASHDATIVLTTHDLAEAERLCGSHLDPQRRARRRLEDSPAGLKRLVAERHGQPATLEDVFMTHTGRSLDDDVEEEESGEDDTRPSGPAAPAHRRRSRATIGRIRCFPTVSARVIHAERAAGTAPKPSLGSSTGLRAVDPAGDRRSMVRFGARLAAERPSRLARSR